MKSNQPILKFTFEFILFLFFPISIHAQDNSLTLVLSEDSNVNSSVKFSLDASYSRYQLWNDQFPSSLIIRYNGLPQQQPLYRIVRSENEDWMFWLLLFLLAFLALIRFGYAKDFQELGQTFKNWGANQLILRELSTGTQFGTVLLNAFSVIVISFYVCLLMQQFKVMLIEPSGLLMILSLLAVTITVFFRYVLLKIAEITFPFSKELRLYNYYEIQINRLLSVILFPFLILITYIHGTIGIIALYTSYCLVGGALLLRYIKGFNLGSSYFSNHLIHFLLYLCALEIAPIIIIIRLLLDLEPIRFSFQ